MNALANLLFIYLIAFIGTNRCPTLIITGSVIDNCSKKDVNGIKHRNMLEA